MKRTQLDRKEAAMKTGFNIIISFIQFIKAYTLFRYYFYTVFILLLECYYWICVNSIVILTALILIAFVYIFF